MVRTTRGGEVEASVTIEGSESVDFIEADRSTSIPANGQETVTLRPPVGSIYVLISARVTVRPPSDATSGTHVFQIKSENSIINNLTLESDHTDNLIYDNSFIQEGTVNQRPTSPGNQTLAVKGLRADPVNGFAVEYFNLTDAEQTNLRQIRLSVREIQVAEQ
jgi:hypothetical protein